MEEEQEETPTDPSQEIDPVKEELDKIESVKAGERTRLERLKYNKERIERELAEEAAKNGTVDEEKPLTLREFKAMQAHEAQETAKSLAETEVMDESERKLVLHYLENTIRPSGDAATDLRNARLMANAVKSRQVAEDLARGAQPRTHTSGAGAPPKQEGAKPELSPEEAQFARGTGLTDEEIAASLT